MPCFLFFGFNFQTYFFLQIHASGAIVWLCGFLFLYRICSIKVRCNTIFLTIYRVFLQNLTAKLHLFFSIQVSNKSLLLTMLISIFMFVHHSPKSICMTLTHFSEKLAWWWNFIFLMTYFSSCHLPNFDVLLPFLFHFFANIGITFVHVVTQLHERPSDISCIIHWLVYWITSTDNFYLIGKNFVGKEWQIFCQVTKIFANE